MSMINNNFVTKQKMNSFCQRCEAKKVLHYCPCVDDRLSCVYYQRHIVEQFLAKAEDSDIREVPMNLYVKGMRAHGYKGQLQKPEKVRI